MKTISIFRKSILKAVLLPALMVSFVTSYSQCCGGGSKSCSKQSSHSVATDEKSNASSSNVNTKTETFGVNGNCGMCKTTIEGALKKQKGIASCNWDQSTKKLTVIYDEKIIKLEQIHQMVANAGYDTDKIKASDQAYNKLPGCCKYERN